VTSKGFRRTEREDSSFLRGFKLGKEKYCKLERESEEGEENLGFLANFFLVPYY
jgi:hypothetical protein